MKVIVLGYKGQLGQSFLNLKFYNFQIYKLPKFRINLTNFKHLSTMILKIKPDVIVNFLAYTKVDLCEIQKNLAYNTNAHIPRKLAYISKKYNCVLIHFSLIMFI